MGVAIDSDTSDRKCRNIPGRDLFTTGPNPGPMRFD